VKRITRRRFLIVMVAAVAALGLGAYLAQAAPSHSPSAPTWLQNLAAHATRDKGDASPTSAQWVLTTERAAAPLVGLTAATAPDDAPEYVVVMIGQFAEYMTFAPSGSSPSRGTCLTFTVDPSSHMIRDFGIALHPPDTSALGEMHSLALTWVAPGQVSLLLREYQPRDQGSSLFLHSWDRVRVGVKRDRDGRMPKAL